MNIINDHRLHIGVVAAAIALALVLGRGAGTVVAVAILGCVAMLGAVMWLVASDARRRSDERDLQDH